MTTDLHTYARDAQTRPAPVQPVPRPGRAAPKSGAQLRVDRVLPVGMIFRFPTTPECVFP